MDPTLINKALRVNIIEALGLQSLPEERKLALIDSLTNLVATKVMMRIDEGLAPEDQSAFDQAIESGTDEQLNVWLRTKNIDLAQILAEELARVKDDLMARADAVDKG